MEEELKQLTPTPEASTTITQCWRSRLLSVPTTTVASFSWARCLGGEGGKDSLIEEEEGGGEGQEQQQKDNNNNKDNAITRIHNSHLDVHYVRYVVLLQRFEPQGRIFTNVQ